MIDIHSHLLYGLDDGPSKIEDSIRMISAAQKQGIKVIISTIHFHESFYKFERIQEKFLKLASRALDFDIVLKLGYEVFINSMSCENFQKLKQFTLDNSKYLLIEFPFSEFPTFSLESIYLLQSEGIVPIISHPERCRFFVENYDVLLSFLESGCLVQLDIGSIVGVYGRHARNMAKRLIKSRKVHFVASNAHFADDYTDWFDKALFKVKKWSGVEYVDAVFNKNAEMITGSSQGNAQINVYK